MPPKKKPLRKPGRRQTVGRPKKGESAKSQNTGLSRRLNDLTEKIDIMMPELTARLAALEHLLLRKEVCTREEMVRAREYVRILED